MPTGQNRGGGGGGPLASPYFLPCLIGVETEGFLDYQGKAGIISIVRWNLRLGIFAVENFSSSPGPQQDTLWIHDFWRGPPCPKVLEKKGALVSHFCANGDTISREAPHSAIGFRGKLLCDTSLVGLVFELR